MAKLTLAAVVLLLSGCGTAGTPSHVATKTAEATASTTAVAKTQPHIMVVTEENQGSAATLGSCAADSYWCSLATSYATGVNWYAVSHPSLPNYLAIASGSTQGCSSDLCAVPSSAGSMGGQLSQAGIPWTAYMESMPSPCYQGLAAGWYTQTHNPFIQFSDVINNDCAVHEQPYPGSGGLLSALNAGDAPDFVWITPNLQDDMHTGSIPQGDAWLRANLDPVLKSSWFTNYPATVIITMDENDASPSGGCCGDASGGQIPLVVVSSKSKGVGAFTTTGSHYGLLRTIEEAYGLPLMGAAGSSANGDFSNLLG